MNSLKKIVSEEVNKYIGKVIKEDINTPELGLEGNPSPMQEVLDFINAHDFELREDGTIEFDTENYAVNIPYSVHSDGYYDSDMGDYNNPPSYQEYNTDSWEFDSFEPEVYSLDTDEQVEISEDDVETMKQAIIDNAELDVDIPSKDDYYDGEY